VSDLSRGELLRIGKKVDDERSSTEFFKNQAETAAQTKRGYLEKLEDAEDAEIFRYLLLAGMAMNEELANQTKYQAEQSFSWSKRVGVVGFVIIVVGVVLAIASPLLGWNSLRPAYLSALAGVLVEFISGVFFFLYTSTLKQVNATQREIYRSQDMAISALVNQSIADDDTRDESLKNLADMMSRAT